MTFKSIAENDELHPLVAHQWLFKAYGSDYLTWEPGALWKTISIDFKISLPRNNKACIQAIRTILSGNDLFRQWFVLEKVLNGLNNNVALFDVIQPPQPFETLFGLEVIQKLRKRLPEIPDETRLYITATCINEGIYRMPLHPVLDKLLAESCKKEIKTCRLPTIIEAERIEAYLKERNDDYRNQSALLAAYTE